MTTKGIPKIKYPKIKLSKSTQYRNLKEAKTVPSGMKRLTYAVYLGQLSEKRSKARLKHG